MLLQTSAGFLGIQAAESFVLQPKHFRVPCNVFCDIPVGHALARDAVLTGRSPMIPEAGIIDQPAGTTSCSLDSLYGCDWDLRAASRWSMD